MSLEREIEAAQAAKSKADRALAGTACGVLREMRREVGVIGDRLNACSLGLLFVRELAQLAATVETLLATPAWEDFGKRVDAVLQDVDAATAKAAAIERELGACVEDAGSL